MKPWYQTQLTEVKNYFDVNPSAGLSDKDVLFRLNKFGKNTDFSINPEIAKVYKATLLRDGVQKQVYSQNIVPGDIILLKPGNRVPADLRLAKVKDFYIDESILTSNSLPIKKNTFAVAKDVSLSDRKCMAFRGSFVVSGQATGIVVAHGENTEYKQVKLHKSPKHGFKSALAIRRLRKMGIIVSSSNYKINLYDINLVIFDMELADDLIAEMIRKIQLGKKISCKFIVSEAQAERLQAVLGGSKSIFADRLTGLIPRQIINVLVDVQFITGVNQTNITRPINILKNSGINILWVTDGCEPMPAMQVASLSIIIGKLARDDVIHRASLIAPQLKLINFPSILYNNK